MRQIKKLLGIVLLIIAIVIFGKIFINSNSSKEQITIKEWNNLYSGNSIKFFYGNEDKRIKKLDEIYSINKLSEGLPKQENKVLLAVDMVNSIVEFDDVLDRIYFNGYDILKNKGQGKKVSGRDKAIIVRDFLTAMGFWSRVGEFRNTNTLLQKEISYYVVEYWNVENKKWVMIDILDKGYFKDGDISCSAIEILSKKPEKLQYIGNKSKSEYLRDKRNIFKNYTIAIDNTLDMEISNSYLTYIQDKEDIRLEYNNKFLPPTIFTSKRGLFDKSPMDNNVVKDTNLNIIVMKCEGANDDFIISAFNNGLIKDKYYMRVNGKDFENINKYKEFTPNTGENKIEVSLDGKEVVASIHFTNNKK